MIITYFTYEAIIIMMRMLMVMRRWMMISKFIVAVEVSYPLRYLQERCFEGSGKAEEHTCDYV